MGSFLERYLKKPGMELYLGIKSTLAKLSLFALYVFGMSVLITGIVSMSREQFVRDLIIKIPEIEPIFTIASGLVVIVLLQKQGRRKVGSIIAFSIAALAFVDIERGTNFGPLSELGELELYDTASYLFILLGVLFYFANSNRN